MKIQDVRIVNIHIPFTLEIAHAMASRDACDSFIIEIATDVGTGYGEVLARDYVSGSLGESARNPDRLAAAADIARKLVSPLAVGELSWPEVRSWIETVAVELRELPILCGLEGALLDCACRAAGQDIYGLLGAPPAVSEIVYGATLPICGSEASRKLIGLFQSFQLSNLRVKLGPDPAYADAALSRARAAFGDGFDLRVDANVSWSYDDAMAFLPLLRRHGVHLIEEPFGRDREENRRFVQDPIANGFTLAADESALTPEDVHRMAREKTFGLVNIRLAKNGGLLRALRMRQAARDEGLAIQVGCHVGETAILSAIGRVAASLMPDALYVDGSYDKYMLAGAITSESFSFGRGGRAPVIRGRRLGYEVDPRKIEEYADGQRSCL